MSNTNIWYKTLITENLVDIIEQEISQVQSKFQVSQTSGGVNLKIRDSENTWLPDYHWIAGLCYHYVLMANRDNFLYDIDHFSGRSLQYTSYSEGEYYNWHNDANIEVLDTLPENIHERYVVENSQKIRKLSLILQLSDPDDYEGGEVQFMNSSGKSFFAPKTRGTILVFDSRTMHRVKKVTSGNRKSIVAWVEGPRWK